MSLIFQLLNDIQLKQSYYNTTGILKINLFDSLYQANSKVYILSMAMYNSSIN